MKLCLTAIAAATLLATTPLAAKVIPISIGPGTSSTDFGQTGSTPGTIDDQFVFTVPEGSVNGLIGSIALTSKLDVKLTSVKLDDTDFNQILTDGTELWTLSPTNIGTGPHSIKVMGTWGTSGGSYAGTLNYTPASAPEASTWAMMVIGFGVVGLAMRRSQRVSLAYS